MHQTHKFLQEGILSKLNSGNLVLKGTKQTVSYYM